LLPGADFRVTPLAASYARRNLVSATRKSTGGKDFFNAKESPMITFKSTKIVQTGPYTFDIEGNFTIRGVTKTEKLTLTGEGKGTPSGSLDGTMAFDRKDYGMNSNIPFIKIANRVEVNVRLKWRRVSGPPPVFQQ
jgi:polyisoprenoid-binding protein YceI